MTFGDIDVFSEEAKMTFGAESQAASATVVDKNHDLILTNYK